MATSSIFIALTGLRAAEVRLSTSARNIANLNTEGFRSNRAIDEANSDLPGVSAKIETPIASVLPMIFDADRASGQQSDTDIVSEQANLALAKRAFEANLKTLKTADEMIKNILDVLG